MTTRPRATWGSRSLTATQARAAARACVAVSDLDPHVARARRDGFGFLLARGTVALLDAHAGAQDDPTAIAVIDIGAARAGRERVAFAVSEDIVRVDLPRQDVLAQFGKLGVLFGRPLVLGLAGHRRHALACPITRLARPAIIGPPRWSAAPGRLRGTRPLCRNSLIGAVCGVDGHGGVSSAEPYGIGNLDRLNRSAAKIRIRSATHRATYLPVVSTAPRRLLLSFGRRHGPLQQRQWSFSRRQPFGLPGPRLGQGYVASRRPEVTTIFMYVRNEISTEFELQCIVTVTARTRPGTRRFAKDQAIPKWEDRIDIATVLLGGRVISECH
jgi:hypothetical protein